MRDNLARSIFFSALRPFALTHEIGENVVQSRCPFGALEAVDAVSFFTTVNPHLQYVAVGVRVNIPAAAMFLQGKHAAGGLDVMKPIRKSGYCIVGESIEHLFGPVVPLESLTVHVIGTALSYIKPLYVFGGVFPSLKKVGGVDLAHASGPHQHPIESTPP